VDRTEIESDIAFCTERAAYCQVMADKATGKNDLQNASEWLDAVFNWHALAMELQQELENA
jgi:hypothetical protein